MCTGTHGFIPASNVITCQLIYDALGQKIENVFNVKSGGGVAVADLDRIKAKILTWYTNSLTLNLPTGVCLSLMVLKDQTTDGGIAKEYAISPAVCGQAQVALLPLNVTVCVKWSSGLVGRSRRGRTYHAGLCAPWISGNQLTPGTQTSLTTIYTALITGLAGGGTVDKLCVLSRCGGGTWRGTALVTDITGCSVDINLDSQRRRLTGRGK